jgi:hypothetical protein
MYSISINSDNSSNYVSGNKYEKRDYVVSAPTIPILLEVAKKYYKRTLGIDLDFSNIKIEEQQ